MAHARTAVLALAALLASCGAQPRREVEPTPEPAPAVQPAPSRGITVAAVGDIMMGTDYPENTLPDDDGVGFLASVAPVLSGADVAFGNLEGVLMDGGEAVKRCKPAKRTTNTAQANGSATPQTAQTPPSPPATPAAPPAIKPTIEPTSEPETSPATPKAEGDGVDTAAAPTSDTDSAAVPAVPVEDTSAADPVAPAQPQASTAETSPAPAAAQTQAPTVPPASASVPTATEPDAASAPAPKSAGSCFVFRTPTRYATYLRDAGLDVASLANNHAQDFGDAGRESTMRALDDVGIRHSGRDGDVAEWTSQGRRFALVAFAPNVGAHQL
ncbi:MAG TPA: CapA family protein, partial [Steroidobacteraceae bacterium]|nr:CapA family protein [Steroidobacteraceae bacterium]